jgi:hypothetical protein
VLNSVAVGYQALALGRTSNQNVAIGTEALTNCSVCTSSVAVGYQALHSMISAGQNTAIGAVAADNMSGTTLNTALGVGALGEVSNGQLNTAVGFLAYPTGNFSNSTVLGYFRGVNASNQVRIGNASVSSIGGQVGWTALSDLRAKSDIMEDVPGWEFIQHLLPVTYHINREFIDGFDKDGKLRSHYQVPLAEADPALHTGLEAGKVLSAAQHHEGLKSIVDTQSGKDGLLGLRYGLLVVPLVKTIQQQQTTIREIENLIAQLEETLTLLK